MTRRGPDMLILAGLRADAPRDALLRALREDLGLDDAEARARLAALREGRRTSLFRPRGLDPQALAQRFEDLGCLVRAPHRPGPAGARLARWTQWRLARWVARRLHGTPLPADRHYLETRRDGRAWLETAEDALPRRLHPHRRRAT